MVSGGNASASWTLPGGSPAGVYTVQATYNPAPVSPNFSGSVASGSGIGTLTVTPGNFLSDVAAADPSFKHIDGFDVLFGKGSTTSILTLKNTNPGTFHYQLVLTNETGTTIHGKGTKLPPRYVNNVAISDTNGASSSVILTVPSLPTNVGTPIPGTAAALANPAFTLQGGQPVKVRPGDGDSGDMPGITIKWLGSIPSGLTDCGQVPDPTTGSAWQSSSLSDGSVVKCIKIDGFSIPRHGKAKIDVNYELRIKNTTGWSSTAQQAFRAGFSFRSSTFVTFDSDFPIVTLRGFTYSANQAAGLVGAGQQVTAVGGFLFDTNGNGVQSAIVRLYTSQAAAQSSNCSSSGQVAQFTTLADGFYFIANTGVNTLDTVGNNLASGIQYYEAICGLPFLQQYWPARYIDHKLANKEFDEEDFYVAAPARIAFGGQPSSARVGRSLGTVTVMVLDGFGNIVTADNSDTITFTLSSGSLGGTVSRTVTNGVASFTTLTVGATGTYTITATSGSWSTVSTSFTISP